MPRTAAISYPQIEAATKEGPEAVAALLHGAGVELAAVPKALRRQLRGEPAEAPKEERTDLGDQPMTNSAPAKP